MWHYVKGMHSKMISWERNDRLLAEIQFSII